MQLITIRTVLSGLFFIAASSAVMADERSEIREKANALQREAAELAEQGHQEEAEKLGRRSRELMEKAEQLQARRRDPDTRHKAEMARRNPDIQHLKERMVDLMAARQKAKERGSDQESKEIGEQIAQTEKKLAHLASQHGEHGEHKGIPEQFRPQAEKLAMAARRVHHVRIAAENLMAAEMPDMAHELIKKAEAMEQDIHAAKMELARVMEAEGHERAREPGGEVSELRSENERLRHELDELREVIERLQIKLEGEPKA